MPATVLEKKQNQNIGLGLDYYEGPSPRRLLPARILRPLGLDYEQTYKPQYV